MDGKRTQGKMKLKIVLLFGLLIYSSVIGAVVTMIAPGLESMSRLVNFVADATMLGLGASAMFNRRGYYGGRLTLMFLGGAVFTVLYNLDRLDLLTNLNGLREPLFFLSALLVLNEALSSEYADGVERGFSFFCLGFAIIQIPIAVMQFRAYGPGDKVGGSLGLIGGSGLLSQLLFLICFYLIVRNASREDGWGFNFRKSVMYSALLMPIALNETKMSFLLLPLFFLLQLDWRRVVPTILVLVFGVTLFLLLNSYYGEHVRETDKVFDQDYLEKYLFYDKREHINPPRFQQLVLMFDLMETDPWTFLLGFGYGHFKGGFFLERSRFSETLYPFFTSQTLFFNLWFQGGLLAVSFVALIMFRFAWSFKMYSGNMKRLAWFLALVLGSMWLYNPAIFHRSFAIVAAFLIALIETRGMNLEESETATEAAPTSDPGVLESTSMAQLSVRG